MSLSKTKKLIIILGSSGFVGKNLSIHLSKDFQVLNTHRPGNNNFVPNSIEFDLNVLSTWDNIVKNKPDYIINCIGYGVVKTENDVKSMFRINYLLITDFYKYLAKKQNEAFLIHIGTAFEYDINNKILNEDTPNLPRSFYGISKLMASEYLLRKGVLNRYLILRLFNMFGPYEDISKIIPALINSQKEGSVVPLTSGLQKRDYMYIKDLAVFIQKLLNNYVLENLPKVINVGTGTSYSIKGLANLLLPLLPNKNPELWEWECLEQRDEETHEFLNGYNTAKKFGIELTPLKKAFEETINYYWKA